MNIEEEVQRRARTPRQVARDRKKMGKETLDMAREQMVEGKMMMAGADKVMEDLKNHARAM